MNFQSWNELLIARLYKGQIAKSIIDIENKLASIKELSSENPNVTYDVSFTDTLDKLTKEFTITQFAGEHRSRRVVVIIRGSIQIINSNLCQLTFRAFPDLASLITYIIAFIMLFFLIRSLDNPVLIIISLGLGLLFISGIFYLFRDRNVLYSRVTALFDSVNLME